MNVLGPCLNPAEPGVQLLGVASPDLLERVAATLAALGIARALVVHGGGLDEVALHAETQAILVSEGSLKPLILQPEDAGLRRRPLEALRGGGPEENAERLKTALRGDGKAVEAEAVALNVGALLMTAGLAADLRDGVAMAKEAIKSGEALRRLEAFVEATSA